MDSHKDIEDIREEMLGYIAPQIDKKDLNDNGKLLSDNEIARIKKRYLLMKPTKVPLQLAMSITKAKKN